MASIRWATLRLTRPSAQVPELTIMDKGWPGKKSGRVIALGTPGSSPAFVFLQYQSVAEDAGLEPGVPRKARATFCRAINK